MIFEKLGLPQSPVILAPLAGVSDHPFRRICSQNGADLTYVEMISATALNYDSPKTLDMLTRHPNEKILGVQITGKTPEETAQAIEKLDKMNFDTIDINMGCPVKKVVKTGCGSAILKDPEVARRYVQLARQATDKPLSFKIRLGWDDTLRTGLEVAQAGAESGADWLTVHGRTRADTYQTPVDLEAIGRIKSAVTIPVIGNGNLFCKNDADRMLQTALVDGLMVSRGALGNPFVFSEIKGNTKPVDLDTWFQTCKDHLMWQQEAYGSRPIGTICMRKHLLWYIKGWPAGKKAREAINQTSDHDGAFSILEEYYKFLQDKGHTERHPLIQQEEGRFIWDPKFEMDRKHDRGVGDDGLETSNHA